MLALRTTTSSSGHALCLLLTVLFVHAYPSKWRGTEEGTGKRGKEQCQGMHVKHIRFQLRVLYIMLQETQRKDQSTKYERHKSTIEESRIGIMHFIYLK